MRKNDKKNNNSDNERKREERGGKRGMESTVALHRSFRNELSIVGNATTFRDNTRKSERDELIAFP